jgi:hypothetical protein
MRRTSQLSRTRPERNIRWYGETSFIKAGMVIPRDEPTRKRVTGGIFRISVRISAIVKILGTRRRGCWLNLYTP